MIELGLSRIARLLPSKLPWRAIHVAGTNGKGSVCAYTSSMLHAAGIRCGRFTSPYLLDRWDGITIDQEVVSKTRFEEVEDQVLARNHRYDIQATPFEVLTATAFEIFARETVPIAVVEVGLGGRRDATNILEDPLVTVITKIAKDHEALLGNTIEEIAHEKAGILKPDSPCVLDKTNEQTVLDILRNEALERQAGQIIAVPRSAGNGRSKIWEMLERNEFEAHQQTNIELAFEATLLALGHLETRPNLPLLADAISTTDWPGRQQYISIKSLTGREQPVLLDGAHNPSSAEVLAIHVNRKLRTRPQAVTWILGASRGKNLEAMISALLKPGDNLVAVEFGPVDSMPWVEATDAKSLHSLATETVHLEQSWVAGTDIAGAFHWASKVAADGPMVIAGSLYLVSEIHRILRAS